MSEIKVEIGNGEWGRQMLYIYKDGDVIFSLPAHDKMLRRVTVAIKAHFNEQAEAECVECDGKNYHRLDGCPNCGYLGKRGRGDVPQSREDLALALIKRTASNCPNCGGDCYNGVDAWDECPECVDYLRFIREKK